MTTSLSFYFFLIFSGAALLATVALYSRQPLLLAYIVLGGLIGPHGFSWVYDADLIQDISSIGIVFLLFLLGLDMQPKALLHVLRKALVVTGLSALLFAALTYLLMRLFGFTVIESLVVGAATTVSSTILGIKLLPTTVLHHRPTGELVVGLLLAQDFVAILVLLGLAQGPDELSLRSVAATFLALPLLAGIALLLVRFLILPLIHRFDQIHEYIFLLAIGWCLGIAELAHLLGLSAEVGAFIAGVTIATSRISQYIAEHLKPLRDFFLILFFFSVGAAFNLALIDTIWMPVVALTLLMVLAKPGIFYGLLRMQGENRQNAWEIGFRMGQMSEFSLLIAYLAAEQALISESASLVIQASAILLFMLSTYLVIFNYPSPIAISARLRRN